MKSLFFLALIAPLVSCGETHNTLTDQERSEGWQLLFNGETTRGWHMYNGPDTLQGWTVENGTLMALGKGGDIGGDIVTDQQYKNFDMKWEWKIAPEGNSGMMYHVNESESFGVPYLTGPEYQLLDDLNFPHELEDWQTTAADYAMYPANPDKKKIKPAGEWNTSRVVFDNGQVEHWLNGEKVVEFKAWSDEWFKLKNSGKWENAPEYGLARKGRICLQDHGSKAWFRNVKIRELPDQSRSYNLFNGEDLHGWVEYGNEKWHVEDGLLVAENGPNQEYGYLATRKYYDNFDITLDFKQVRDGNSGLFFRCTLEDTSISGWQVEIAPPGKNTGGIYESDGRGWLIQIPEEKKDVLNYKEWNTLRARVNGGKVTTWLNGEKMIELEDKKIENAKGRVALQIHDDSNIKILFRNIVLEER